MSLSPRLGLAPYFNGEGEEEILSGLVKRREENTVSRRSLVADYQDQGLRRTI